MKNKISKNTTKEAILKLASEEECKKCGHCCSFGGGFVLNEELKKIAEFLKISEEELKEKQLEINEKFNSQLFRTKIIKDENKPYGKCVFLEENKLCKIQSAKPLYCKIGNCGENAEKFIEWFNLNFFVNPKDPESIRQWAQYLELKEAKNETIPGGKVNELVKDEAILKKMLNYDMFK